jgi:hypothetical protein
MACQNLGVTEGSGVQADLIDRVAKQLAVCRHRGLERLDVVESNQPPVVTPDLDALAGRYAVARNAPGHDRVSVIKSLLRAAIDAFAKDGNVAEGRLVSDLFFGDATSYIARSGGDLLRVAQDHFGEPSEGRFRLIRRRTLVLFSTFLLEYVSEAELQAAPPSSIRGSAAAVQADDPSLPIAAAALLGSPPIEIVLQFAWLDPGGSGRVTIDEHRRLIAENGSCWWGWFKAEYDLDHAGPLTEMRANLPATVALWVRREDLFYTARCESIEVADGQPTASPDPQLTPAYYRDGRWPAWFRFTAIDSEPTGRQEVTARFGRDIRPTGATVLWRSSSRAAEAPFTAAAAGTSVLHLSDLHFGSKHRWNTYLVPERASRSAEEAIARTLELHEIAADSIGVVVISGNFSSDRPTDGAFSEAKAFIDGLCGRLPHVNPANVVILPGAEDFERPGRSNSAHQTLYRRFHDAVYGEEKELDLDKLRRYEFPLFRLNVLPINSVKFLGEGERHHGLFGRGYDSALSVMRQDYLTGRAHGRRVVNVVAAHHHLISTTIRLRQHDLVVDSEMPGISDARDVLQRLRDNKVRLFLHGHLHSPESIPMPSNDGWQFWISGAGTAGAAEYLLRDTMYPRNHLAVFDFGPDTIRCRVLGFDEEFLRYPIVGEIAIPDQTFQSDLRPG